MSVTYSINKNPLFVQIQAVGGAPHFTETLLCPEFLSLELELYSPELLRKPIVLCLNKIDISNATSRAEEVENALASADWTEQLSVECRPVNPIRFRSVFKTCAKSCQLNGLREELRRIYDFSVPPPVKYNFEEARDRVQLV